MGYSAVMAFIAVAGYFESSEERAQAKRDSARAAGLQQKANAEQKAGDAAQAAAERRRQDREERVRRARILQTAQASGTAGSTGETGAIGGLATQLGSNLGVNGGAIRRSGNISDFNQQAADFSFSAQGHMAEAANIQELTNLSMNLFKMNGSSGGGNSTPDGQPGSRSGSAF